MSDTKKDEVLTERERQLELEERAAALELRQLEISKLRREKATHELSEQDRQANIKQKGEALKAQLPHNLFRKIRSTCNHRMGNSGKPLADLAAGHGAGDQYCVVKTKLPTGDVFIKCQRCRTIWVPAWPAMWWKDRTTGRYLPAVEAAHMSSAELNKVATFDAASYKAAQDDYLKAFNFTTQLAPVILPQYRWARSGKDISREVTYRFLTGSLAPWQTDANLLPTDPVDDPAAETVSKA